MSQEKYIGMDVHQATISAAVMDAHGKLLMECLLETKASTIVDFIQGLHGTLSLTFEEGTSAAWLHDLLKPQVSRLVVCDPRKAARLKEGNKSDRIDARKRAELLRTNQLKAVYHEEHGIRALKELGRSYLTITQDVTRVMNRIKALRSVRFAPPCWWPCCRHPTASVPSASCGPTAVSRSRLTTVARTAGCEANCSATASASPCAV